MTHPNTIQLLLAHEIKDLYSAETQLVKALRKMAKAAQSEELQDAFTTHLEETEGHVARLEEIAALLGTSPQGKDCKAMKGLVQEGSETIEVDGDSMIRDLALIGAALKVEHYEISGYGTARALAEALELEEVVSLLQATLDEEEITEEILTSLAEQLLPQALEEAGTKSIR